MRWTWDPDKNELNRNKHRISFETAILVFDDPDSLTWVDQYSYE